MACDEGFDVAVWFWKTEARAREDLKTAWSLGRRERVSAANMDHGLRIGSEVHDGIAADELDAESCCLASLILFRIKEERHTGRGGESCVHLVPCERADSFRSLFHISGFDRTPFSENRCITAGWYPREKRAEIEDMGSQDPQVQCATPAVLLSARSHLEESAEHPLFEEVCGPLECGMITVTVRDGDASAVFGCELPDVVRLFWGPDERFFDIDPFDAGEDRVGQHLVVLVHMPRADGDDVWVGFFEEVAMIREGGRCAETFDCGGSAGLIGIGDPDDGCVRCLEPHRVEAVPVVPAAGVTDDPDAQGGCLRMDVREDPHRCERSDGGEELASDHEGELSTRGARDGAGWLGWTLSLGLAGDGIIAR